MNNQPLVSIIVPCYNVEQYVGQCIKSIVQQTYSNIELILVDDGSSDRTPSICDDFAKRDSRIKVIHKPNGGLVSARNAGYDVVTGDWMMYVDGDDWIEENTCEELLKHLRDYPDYDIVFWRCVMELGEHSIFDKWGSISSKPLQTYEGDECIELSRNSLVYTSGIATAYDKLIRTEYAKKYNIRHDDRLKQGAEGLEFSVRAFYYAKKALFVNQFFYHYRYVVGSITKKVNERNVTYLTDCLNIIQENILKFKRKDDFQKQLYQRVVYALISVAMSTYFNKANKESFSIRSMKFDAVIQNNELYQKSVALCETAGMDKKRKLTLFFIQKKMYFMLDFIERCKEYMIKKGKFNY